MDRLERWPELLSAHVEKVARITFEWGLQDCCLFTADCVKAMTTVDIAIDWRGQYHSEDEMQELMALRALASLEQVAESIANTFELAEVQPRQGCRGDTILFEGPAGPTIGIILDHRLVTTGPAKLFFARMDTVWDLPTTRVWKI